MRRFILMIFIFILSFIIGISNLRALTTKPNQKPCEPGCCIILKNGYVVYYCFVAIATCTIDCNIDCKDPETQQYTTYYCGSYTVQFELCKRWDKVTSVSGCNFDETWQIEGLLTEHANGTCPNLCAEYYRLDCRGFHFIHSCTFELSKQ